MATATPGVVLRRTAQIDTMKMEHIMADITLHTTHVDAIGFDWHRNTAAGTVS